MQLNRQRKEGTPAGDGDAAAPAEAEERDHFKGTMKMQGVAGSINTDRQELKVAELQLLFQVRACSPCLLHSSAEACTWICMELSARMDRVPGCYGVPGCDPMRAATSGCG